MCHRRRPRINAASVPDFSSSRFQTAKKEFLFAICYLLFAIRPSFLFLLPTHHSQRTSSRSPPPIEGRAERRWRSDACEAPVSARHDRRAVASLDHAGRPEAVLGVCRVPGEPGLRSISQAGRAGLSEASCVPSDGDARLSALHVGFLARARACRCPAFPPRSCGQPHMPHGSSLPGGAGLANLPGAAANRIRGHHSLGPPCKNASRRRPSGPRIDAM
jgi:hypothetical protein